MKVALLIPALTLGGAERQINVLAEGLKSRGHETVVLVFYGGGALENDLLKQDIPIINLHKRGRSDLFGFLSRLWRVVRREKPQALIAHLGVPNMAASLLNPFWPQTKVILGIVNASFDFAEHDFLWRLCAFVEPKIAHLADLVMSNSRVAVRDAVKAGFPEKKMVVIHNGIDTKYFNFDPLGRQRVRREWGIADNERLIGLTARLAPMKDHHSFFQAAAILAKQRPEARFVCIGKGSPEYTQKLRELANHLDLGEKLIWAGGRLDMPAVYSALDLGCLASRFGEGLSNAVAEAMACSVPCAVTDFADTPDVVRGVGEICPVADSNALATVLGRLWDRLNKEGQEFKDAVRQRIVERYSMELHLDKVEEMLDRLVTEKPDFNEKA